MGNLILEILVETIIYVGKTLIHNAPILIFGMSVAAAITVYMNPEKLKAALTKKSGFSILGSVAFGVLTPFCACGTMAIAVSMMASVLPWGPIMAFLTSSPLMSPDAFILYAGIINIKFASALVLASIGIGVISGCIAHIIDGKTTFLKNQFRFINADTQTACCAKNKNAECSCCCSDAANKTDVNGEPAAAPGKFKRLLARYKIKELFKALFDLGIKKVLPFFALFAAIGHMINRFVPAELIMKYLGAGNSFAVPLLSLIGLPLYVNSSSTIPLVKSLIAAGTSQGALLAFMITGPGTSVGVITGLLTIMRKNAVLLYTVLIVTFAIAFGYLFDLVLLVF